MVPLTVRAHGRIIVTTKPLNDFLLPEVSIGNKLQVTCQLDASGGYILILPTPMKSWNERRFFSTVVHR
jgi:hypothetical protein